MTSGVWVARYPDLAGKVALVTGDHIAVVEVAAMLAANGAPLGVVSSERAIVDAALAAAEATSAMGIVSPPGEPATWKRVVPHAEQRLGPLDVVVAIGPLTDRQAVLAATLPDMAARGRGVIVEVGETTPPLSADGRLRRRFIEVDVDTSAADLAAAVVFCASDVLTAAVTAIRLTR